MLVDLSVFAKQIFDMENFHAASDLFHRYDCEFAQKSTANSVKLGKKQSDTATSAGRAHRRPPATDHSIRHMPFPIDLPLEQSL